MKSGIQVTLSIMLFGFFVPSGMSLECYKCATTSSWDDCKQEKMTCPKLLDRCIKAEVKFGDQESFAKYCAPKVQCDKESNPTCKIFEALGTGECSVSCCEGDLCNAGSSNGVSGMVMMACAVAILVFLKAF